MKGTPMKSQWPRRPRLRQLVVAGAALTTLAVVAACGGSKADSSSSGRGSQTSGSFDAVDAALKTSGTITYWSCTPSPQAQVDAFMKQHPNLNVNYVNAR